MGVPEGEEKVAESLFKEIMSKNHKNLGKEKNIQIHEAQKSPNIINSKKTTLKPIIIKLSEVKDK